MEEDLHWNYLPYFDNNKGRITYRAERISLSDSMSRKLAYLNALHAVEASTRLGSFARAAKELGVTPAAVGQQVRIIEEYLGFKLFTRTPSGLRPTIQASPALDELRTGFGFLETAFKRLQGNTSSAQLSVSAAPALAGRWVAPRLRNLYERCPQIDLRMDTSLSLVDIADGEFNLAIRYGPEDKDLDTTLLFQEYILPVCIPDLCESSPGLASGEELLRLPLLHIEGETSDTGALSWAAWGAYHGIYDELLNRGPRYPHSIMALQAAFDGQGVALCGLVLALDDLNSGRLIAPLGAESAVEAHYAYRIVRASKSAPPVQQVFIDWIEAEARKTREVVSRFVRQAMVRHAPLNG